MSRGSSLRLLFTFPPCLFFSSCIEGHVKVIDFGTAKDILETDLNGPDFVGTAEYMCPSTVNSQASGVEADLWALGVILYQILFGYTPFAAHTPYLTFLRIKKGKVRLPAVAPEGVRELLDILLESNPVLRFQKATVDQPELVYEDYLGLKPPDADQPKEPGQESTVDATKQKDSQQRQQIATLASGTHASSSAEGLGSAILSKRVYKPPHYDTLRINPFFNNVPDIRYLGECPRELTVNAEILDWKTAHFLTANAPTYHTVVEGETPIGYSAKETSDRVEFLRSVHRRHAVRIEKLSELSIKAVAEACVKVAEETALLGGSRPDIPWIQVCGMNEYLTDFVPKLFKLDFIMSLILFHVFHFYSVIRPVEAS